MFRRAALAAVVLVAGCSSASSTAVPGTPHRSVSATAIPVAATPAAPDASAVPHVSAAPSAPASPPPASGPAATAVPGTPVPVVVPSALPSSNARIGVGAWVDPDGDGPATIGALETAIGRRLDFGMHYEPLGAPFPNAAERDDAANGRTPIVSLGCSTPSAIARGSDDAIIDRLAADVRAFATPVVLRYCPEMNLGFRALGAKEFVAGWRYLHDRMVADGVTNVRWFFCPGVTGADATSGLAYYPGDAYVDDVGFDVYDNRNRGFQAMLDPAYRAYASFPQPIVVGETGEKIGAGQQTFLTASTATLVRSAYPKITAIVYFDADGANGNWTLDAAGLTAFGAFALAAE